jgi:hypothetical protein
MLKKTAMALALALALAVPFGAGAAPPKRPPIIPPKSGSKFEGGTAQHRKLMLMISGKTVQIVAFKFNCGPGLTGNTSLQSIQLTKGKYGYKFDSKLQFGHVTYSDEVDDEDARVNISGKFNRVGKRVTGALRVRTTRCGDTTSRRWYANRQ